MTAQVDTERPSFVCPNLGWSASHKALTDMTTSLANLPDSQGVLHCVVQIRQNFLKLAFSLRKHARRSMRVEQFIAQWKRVSCRISSPHKLLRARFAGALHVSCLSRFHELARRLGQAFQGPQLLPDQESLNAPQSAHGLVLRGNHRLFRVGCLQLSFLQSLIGRDSQYLMQCAPRKQTDANKRLHLRAFSC